MRRIDDMLAIFLCSCLTFLAILIVLARVELTITNVFIFISLSVVTLLILK